MSINFRTFASVLDGLRSIAPLWERVVRQRAITTALKDNGTVAFELHPGEDAELRSFLDHVWHTGGVTAIEEVYVTARLIAEGPKVFRPATDQCESLEQVDPRVTVAEYRQPCRQRSARRPRESAA
jgi:hypothetical protein